MSLSIMFIRSMANMLTILCILSRAVLGVSVTIHVKSMLKVAGTDAWGYGDSVDRKK